MPIKIAELIQALLTFFAVRLYPLGVVKFFEMQVATGEVSSPFFLK
jgi:hypothetical protein